MIPASCLGLLRRLQHELDLHGLERELDPAVGGAGEDARLAAALERAVANHGGSFPWMLFVHAFVPVRREPRVLNVLERIGYTGTSAVLLGRED